MTMYVKWGTLPWNNIPTSDKELIHKKNSEKKLIIYKWQTHKLRKLWRRKLQKENYEFVNKQLKKTQNHQSKPQIWKPSQNLGFFYLEMRNPHKF